MVWATDIDQAALKSLADEIPDIHTQILNVRDSAAVTGMAEEIGAIDVLFNCAGYVHQGSISECSAADWDFSWDLNVSSMYRTCKAFLPGMIRAGSGSIINMSSVASSIKGAPNRFVYGTTKAAIIGFTKAIAVDFVAKGVRCNAICPGTVETPSLAERISAAATVDRDEEAVRTAFVERQPMGRLGRPEEIAEAALYLASVESSFITGQTIIIDGGWSI